MVSPSGDDITQLLRAWGDGNQAALDRLMPLVYAQLRQAAHRYMARERRGHTLQTTALVNEVYVRLAKAREMRWQDRVHFFALSAQMMRRILTDHARARQYAKRGGERRWYLSTKLRKFLQSRAPIWWRSTTRSSAWPRLTSGRVGWWSFATSGD